MATISLPQPSIGQPVSTEDPKIVALLAALTTEVNDRELAFTTWKPLQSRAGYLLNGVVGSVFVAGVASVSMTTVGGVGAYAEYAFPFDPADVAAGSRTTQLRLRVKYVCNAVAPGVNLETALYPVTAYSAAATVQPKVNTVGAQTSGSAVTITTPASNATATVVSSAFTRPSAGDFLFGVALSGSQAANSVISFLAELQYRQV